MTENLWPTVSLSEKFKWAASGDIALDRAVFCSALGIERFPTNTMLWPEWCAWLYKALSPEPLIRDRNIVSASAESNWWFRQIAPWIDKRTESKPIDIKEPVVTANILDGFRHEGQRTLVLPGDNRTWTILGRVEGWDQDRYILSMFLNYNNFVPGGAPVVEWGYIYHDKPRHKVGLSDLEVVVVPKKEAIDYFLTSSRRIAMVSSHQQEAALAAGGAECIFDPYSEDRKRGEG